VTDQPAAGAPLRISVVVVNWNGGDMVQDCLRSLVADGDPSGTGGVEILLVDNASTDGSPDRALAAFPGVRLVRRPGNEGFAAAANEGIRHSRGAVVVLVNNDACVLPGFLDALTAPMAAPGGADIAAVTGRVLLAGHFRPAGPDDEPGDGLVGRDGGRWVRVSGEEGGVRLLNSTGNLVTRSGNGGDRDWLAPADAPPAPAEVFGFNGGCVALRRRALDEVGLFDAGLFMYFEDTELSWRLRRAGWRIAHAHGAVTEHRHAASSGTATSFFQFHNARNRLLVALSQAPWGVVLRAVGRTLVRLAVGPRRGPTARALVQALVRTPAALGRRRATDRTATVPRREVARWLMPD
jgi:GT2 family glycosyltransferase